MYNNIPAYYMLEDGRIWSVADSKYIAEDDKNVEEYISSGYGFGTAPDANGDMTESGLRNALVFYGLPQGILMPLYEAQATTRISINAGFDAAMTASLTMPSAHTPASAFAVYQAIEAWKAEDPEGYATLLAIHTARRDALLAAVAAAETAAAVQAIVVSYAV